MREPVNVFLDSDGPICNFDKALNDSCKTSEVFKHLPGVYLYLEITPGATDALSALQGLEQQGFIKVWVLTKTPSHSPYAYTEKVLWYRQHFPWLENRVILSHDKSIVGRSTDFLLDDRPWKGNAAKFPGEFVFFDITAPVVCWNAFVRRVMEVVTKNESA